ncbi:MAG: LysM peptidoglycan-binding domain-containing protein [Myxococcota bacterium]
MRKHLFTAAFCLFALSPVAAFAQSDEEVAAEEDNAQPEGAATVAPSDSEKSQAPGSQHTVEKGDTLWDLSQRYLGSPWYWPKVWSYNPEIANPHWIYPGNLVRFFPTGEEVPTQVEVGQPETPDILEGQLIGDDDRVQVAGQIGFRPRSSLSVLTPGFITTQEVQESGRIEGSFGETEHLFFPETVYVSFAKAGTAKVGETYLIFRNMGEVLHPVTQEPVGVYTRIVGQMKVTGLDKGGMAKAVIVRQQDVVMRGDLLGPGGEEMMRQVAARPNERDVKDAFVVGAPNRALNVFAEHQLLIIDKGSDDGVKNGSTFSIWRQHDALAQDNMLNPSRIEEQWPREDVGECVAFEVKSKTTICLVSKALRELVRGDHAEIRASSSRRASR